MAEDDLETKPKPRKRREKQTKTQGEEISLQTGIPKLKIDDLLQQVVAQSTKEALEVKKKRKKRGAEGDVVLESLRSGKAIEGLHKEEDPNLQNNIYEPDNSPKNEKSNKQRQKKLESDQKKDNLEVAEDEKKKTKRKKKTDATRMDTMETAIDSVEPSRPVAAPREKKRTKKSSEREVSQLPREDSAASPKPNETPVSSARAVKKRMKQLVEQLDSQVPTEEATPHAADTPVTSPSPGRQKRKKRRGELEVGETGKGAESADTKPSAPPEALETAVASPKEEKKKKKKQEGRAVEEEEAVVKEEQKEEQQDPKPETKKGKVKKKKGEEETEVTAALPAQDKKEAVSEDVQPVDVPDVGEVLAVMVHRTDKLKNDFKILHPMVRVHIVDEATGKYLPKQHKDRAVSSFYELKELENILPIMTQPFDFKQQRSTIPMWEELIVFNENFNYFVQTSPRALMLFELRDFISMQSANNKSEIGWHRIAWAFLKIVGGNGKINVGNKIRLQLFEVPNRKYPSVEGVPEAYHWWQLAPRHPPYPSTLYVTLKSIVPPVNVEPSTRSMFALQKEEGAMTYEDLKRSMNWDSKTRKLEGQPLTSWTRLFGQLCRIPNNQILVLPAGKKGCFVIRFSHDGRSLACACGSKDSYPVLIYEIPSGELKHKLQGHFSLVYDMCWSRKDTHLLTASADGTVRQWNILEDKKVAERVLPHPGFVYCCMYHPRADSIAVTGCFDQVLRIWDVSQDDEKGQLLQEIEDHQGYINSICFEDDEGQKMYSADSEGTINIWNVYVTDEPDRRPFVRDWTLFHSLQEPEMKNVQINHIEMHPSGRRLLVHCRDGVIRMIDLRVQRVMQQYIGAVNFREKIGSCVTPCGTFVFAGSEDGHVYVWNTDTGDQVACYTDLNYSKPVTDVAFHPRDHILAICCLGENQPVLIYKFDPFTKQRWMIEPSEISSDSAAQLEVGATSPRGYETTDVQPLAAEKTSSGTSLNEEELTLARSKVMTKDEFEAHEKLRVGRAMKKLETATMQMSQMPGMVPDTSRRMEMIGRSGVVSTWSAADTDYIATPRSNMPTPSALSPHAPRTMSSILQQQQFASQKQYTRRLDSSWRPSFSEVGRHGSKQPYYGRPPNISVDMSLGKPQFTIQTPIGSTKKLKKVVALYDYKGQRSDELTIVAGEHILLLYKDSDVWWMGEKEDGTQGFFPANYVTLVEGDEDEDEMRKSYTAIKTKDGELKFLSGGEESENEAGTEPETLKSATITKKRVHYSD